MNRRPSARSVVGVLIVLVAATLGTAGVVASAMPTPSYGYDLSQAVSDSTGSTAAKGVDEQGVRASGVPPRRGPHSYDDLANLAPASARPVGYRLTPRAAGLADGAVTTGARATGHGAERLAQAGSTDDLIAQTRAGFVTRQADGATVFAREVSPGRFDFFVEGQRGVVTAHRNWSQKSIDRLARNYGWEDWPP